MNKNDYKIRLERKEEYREVENLVRKSFWNVYRPGCIEHYVLNRLRNDDAEASFFLCKELKKDISKVSQANIPHHRDTL